MNRNLKIGLALLIVASVFFLCSTVAFIILRESERQKRLYIEEKLQIAITANESIAKDLEQIKVVNQDLAGKLNTMKEQAREISEELAKEKEAKKQLASQVEREEKKADQLMADIMKEKEERLSFVHKLAKAEDSYRKLKDQFELMVGAKESLEGKLKKMMAKKGVELEKIEVRPGRQAAGPRIENLKTVVVAGPVATNDSPEANVLIVNRKFGFIVANIGKLDGVDIGTELNVYRNGELIAKTKIEKLYDKMSAATILPKWKNVAIREGDPVHLSK